MPRRLVVLALIMAVFPTSAAAQTPVDDRTAARAFADAALRAQGEIAAASQQLEALGQSVDCNVRVPKRRRAAISEFSNSLHFAQVIAGFARTVGPALQRASDELHGVHTTDAVLKSGRTGWRRLRRTYASFAALPAANVCTLVRAYVRNRYRHTRQTRRAMIELGIPASEADAFDGELGE